MRQHIYLLTIMSTDGLQWWHTHNLMLPQQYLWVYYYVRVSTDGLQWWHTHNLMLPQQYLWVYYYVRVSKDARLSYFIFICIVFFFFISRTYWKWSYRHLFRTSIQYSCLVDLLLNVSAVHFVDVFYVIQ